MLNSLTGVVTSAIRGMQSPHGHQFRQKYNRHARNVSSSCENYWSGMRNPFMLKTPKTSAAKTETGLAPDRPFERALWKRAERIAAQYEIVIWFEDSEWYGCGLELL